MHEVTYELAVNNELKTGTLEIEATSPERALETALHVLEEKYGDQDAVLLELIDSPYTEGRSCVIIQP